MGAAAVERVPGMTKCQQGANCNDRGRERRTMARVGERRRALALGQRVTMTACVGVCEVPVTIARMSRPTNIIYVFKRVMAPEYKIGITNDVAHRLATLRIQMASALEVVLTVEGTRRDEAALHAMFAEERLFGEWFHESPRLLAWIAEQGGAV